MEGFGLERAQPLREACGVNDLRAATRRLGEAGLDQLGVVRIVLDEKDPQAR
jgi:hypothetical protein